MSRRFVGLSRRPGSRWSAGGGASTPTPTPPTITVAPVLAWTVEIGQSPTLTDPVYTGDPGTITWTLYRDGIADGTIAGVSKATAEAYTAVAADIGPDLHFEALVTNGAGADSDVTNTVVFNDATYLADTAIGVSTAGLTLADSDTTVDAWASSLGGVSATLSAAAVVNRPAYSATGGAGSRPLVTGDGVQSLLTGTVTKGSAFASIEMGLVGARSGSPALSARYLTYIAGTSGIRGNSTDTFRGQWQGGSTAASTSSAAANAHTSVDCNSGAGATLSIRVAGTAEGTAAYSVSAQADGGTLYLFGDVTTNLGAYAAQAWYLGPQLTADQRTHLRALLTYHTGIAS